MNLRELFAENIERTGESKTAVIGWGRGMGHKGHMYLADAVISEARDTDSDPYFVVSRTMGKDDPLTPEEKLYLYKKVFPKMAHIFHTASEELPDLNRVLKHLGNLGYTDVTVVVGADQKPAFQYLVKPDKSGVEPYKQFGFDSMRVISRQETSSKFANVEGPRATPMRDILKDPSADDDKKFAAWRDAMNPEISDDEVRDLMKKAHTRMSDPSFGKKPKSVKEANALARSLREGSSGKVGKGGTKNIDKEKKSAMKNAVTIPGLNQSTGSAYKNYRMSIALAGAPTFPTKIEADNWIGGDPLISSYTEEEFEMVKAAALQVGAGTIQNWSGNRSEEMADVNKTSAVAKIKKNKYGV